MENKNQNTKPEDGNKKSFKEKVKNAAAKIPTPIKKGAKIVGCLAVALGGAAIIGKFSSKSDPCYIGEGEFVDVTPTPEKEEET